MKYLRQLLKLIKGVINGEAKFDSVRVKNFILEDSDGNKKAELLVDKQGNVVLHFLDNSGQSRLYVGITSEGTPRVGLTYGNGKGSIQLEANDRLKTSAIVFCGVEGKPQILLGISNTGIPAIGLYDKEGKLIFPKFDKKPHSGTDELISPFLEN